MEAKHTPGPWIHNKEFHLYEKDSYSQIKIGEQTYITGCISDADAELIASAPDLLEENTKLKTLNAELIEALEKVERSLYLHPDCTENSEFNDLVLTINELIKKAKGGE